MRVWNFPKKQKRPEAWFSGFHSDGIVGAVRAVWVLERDLSLRKPWKRSEGHYCGERACLIENRGGIFIWRKPEWYFPFWKTRGVFPIWKPRNVSLMGSRGKLPLGLLLWLPCRCQRSRNCLGRLFSFFIFFLFYSSIYILRLLLKCLLICLLIYSCRLRWKPLFCWVFWGSLACWFACWRLCCLFVAQCVDNENGDAHKAPYLGHLWHISSLLKTLLMGLKKGTLCDIWDMFCMLKSNACTPPILKMMFFWFFRGFGGGVSPLYRGFLSGL